MFLKFICLCCVTAYIIAAPLKDEVSVERQQPTVIPIISLSAEYVADGKFKYNYETGNGIKREETAYDKESPDGKSHSDCSNEGGEDDDSGEIHVQKGSYSYTAPDGTLVSVRYIADENGFQPIITEVSHSRSQLSSDLSQNLRQSDHGEIAKGKTTDHSETEHKNTEPKQKDLEDKIPLKFGDKLKKSEKLIKEEPLKRNNSHDEKKVVNAAIPNKESQKSTNSLIPVDTKDRNKTDSIIHEEPLSTVENSASKIRKPSSNEQISDTKKEIPSKVENKTTDKENEEYVPDKDEKKTKNGTGNPSQNIDKLKKNDGESHQGKEVSDTKKPNAKKEESDKLKEDLAPKKETAFKTENNNDNEKNTTDKNKKANPEAETKPLKTEKNTTMVRSPEAVVKPQENEENSTKSKINTERKSEHETNIPEKQNKKSEHTETANSDGEQGSENVLNIPKNKNDDTNLHDLPNNVMENSHETKNPSAKTEKKPSKSETKSPKHKNELDSKDQLPEKKKNKPSLENASSSLEAEKNLGNSQKNKPKQSLNADGLNNNKSDTSDSIKTKPYKENIKIANETNKLEIKNKKLNYTDGMTEREIKKPHKYENVSAESEKEPIKSRIQTPENKEIKNEMTERNTDDFVKKTDKEEEKGNEDGMNNQNHKETPVNSTDNLPHNLKEENSKLDKQMINNNNISNNTETNEDMTKNLVSNKDKSPPKSISGHQTIPEQEATSDKKEKLDKKNPSKEMEENKTPPTKEENNILKKNETLKDGESVTNNTEKTASPTELLNGTLIKDILKEVQKPVKEAEKHEKVAEKAAKKAVKAAEVAENAADTAQKAAKDTEAILKTLNQTGNHSRELAISAAIKHAKLAGDAAKEAVKAAEMAEIAADNAKNAAQAAEKVVELVQSSSNTKHFKELINKAGDAVKDAKKSSTDAVHAAKDATKQSESLPKTELKNIDANITPNL